MPTWTADDLLAINAAIRQALRGRTVSFADRSWTSQDLDALRRLRDEIEAAVEAASRPRQYVAVTRKGL
jgi:hypothetical protein